ncbi:MAG: adenylosuccinate lyase [Thermoanaerobaculia bacterium]
MPSMPAETPQNVLYDRYASAEMCRIFSARHRYSLWRQLWMRLAECQQELGLPITDEQLAALRQAAPRLDLERVAEIERETRHDVVSHLRHFAEQAGEAGSILHLGATSAFITDNTDLLILREALDLVHRRVAAVIRQLAAFAARTRGVPTLAYTHFQPAQLTTVGKRACLWAQDFVTDLEAIGRCHDQLRCRGVKGTTGTQASYLTLFEGDHDKVRRLDRLLAEKLGFAATFPITGQTYPRKQDSQILGALVGVAESSHKLGTDLRLLQGVGELSEPFGAAQVGSSAMAYKRNPIRAERMCALSRRLITDGLNGPLTASLQWLERSLDDSSIRRLVLPDSFMIADSITGLAAGIAAGLVVREETIRHRVQQEMPFMATETILMKATVGGGDRQELHERLRRYSMEAHEAVARGENNPLIEKIMEDTEFGLERSEIEACLDARLFTGRSARQVEEYLDEVVEPALADIQETTVEEPRV